MDYFDGPLQTQGTVLHPQSPAQARQNMGRFLRWLRTNGAAFAGLHVQMDQGSRRIVARRPLRRGELIAYLPQRLLLKASIAQKSDIGRLVRENVSEPNEHMYLAAYLLATHRRGGFFHPFVDILPRDLSHLPEQFSEREFACLAGTMVGRRIAMMIARLKCEHAELAPHLPPDLMFSEAEYAWAKGAVRSRAFNVRTGDKTESALVPLIDLLNHDAAPSTVWNGDSNAGFLCTASKPSASGEELTDTYGPFKSNSELFGGYGFALNPGRYDETELCFAAPPINSWAARATDHLGVKLPGERCFMPRASFALLETEMVLVYLRLLVHNCPGHDGLTPINRTNELMMLGLLAKGCRARLAEFSSPDLDPAPTDSNAVARLETIRRVRDGEISVIHYLLGLAAAGIARLRGEVTPSGYDDYLQTLEPLLASSRAGSVFSAVAKRIPHRRLRWA